MAKNIHQLKFPGYCCTLIEFHIKSVLMASRLVESRGIYNMLVLR